MQNISSGTAKLHQDCLSNIFWAALERPNGEPAGPIKYLYLFMPVPVVVVEL